MDTSFWFALVVASDNNHLRTAETARGLQRKGEFLVTTTLILAETHRLILYKLGAWAGTRFLAQIAKQVEAGFLHVIEVSWAQIVDALCLLDKYKDLPLSLVDACSAVVMREGGIARYAGYDEHFRLLEFEQVQPLDRS
ncbi:MAG: type II toxin-antitoxin system VapC family toxin [Bacteroidota bacterium]